eukprot:8054764-Pyramimonas_sp.AAC.1
MNSHGPGKYECLFQSGTMIAGNHYTSWNAYWGTIEYRLIRRDSSCNPFTVDCTGRTYNNQ